MNLYERRLSDPAQQTSTLGSLLYTLYVFVFAFVVVAPWLRISRIDSVLYVLFLHYATTMIALLLSVLVPVVYLSLTSITVFDTGSKLRNPTVVVSVKE